MEDFRCSLTYLLKLFKILATNQFQKPKNYMVRFSHCHDPIPLIIFYSSFVLTVTTHLAETRTKRIKIKMPVIIVICKYNHAEQGPITDLNLPASAYREL